MPNATESQLRNTCRALLSEGTVQKVIGYRQGRAPYHVSPAFITTPEDCDQLILTPFCAQNLVRYLRGLKPEDGKVAIVVKGCDSRTVNELIAENQLNREQLHLLGLPCPGVVDVDKLARHVDLREVQEVRLEGDEVILVTEEASPPAPSPGRRGGMERHLPVADLLEDTCLHCQYPNPVTFDELLGPEVPARNPEGEDAELARLEAMTSEERREYFRRAFERCIRCYACVKNCPLCFCTTCFAQTNQPEWLPRTVGADENEMFLLGRAMHLAGRCVQCGACDRACPMNLPLRLLNAKMAKEAQEAFAQVAGLDPETQPPLSVFESQDKDIAEHH